MAEKKNFQITLTCEPGGSENGRRIREILLDPTNTDIVPDTELLLYIADRVQHIQEVIQPAIRSSKIVICDRYHDSTLAYQGGGRKLSLEWLSDIQKLFILNPDVTFWFDLPVEEAQKRILERRNEVIESRIDDETFFFHERVADKYCALWKQNPDRIIRIDASLEISEVSTSVIHALQYKFPKFITNSEG